MGKLMKGDCLERLKEIPDNSVDLILTDPPYGTTACKWDSVIPFERLWPELRRVRKERAAVVMTASQPFTTVMIASNMAEYHHSWVWNKKFSANYPQAKRQPLRIHEDVVVFGRVPSYRPQMVDRDKPIKKGANRGAEIFGGSQHLNRPEYEGKVYEQKYPESIICFSSRLEPRGLHPTQKPVALMEYLIRTYTDEGATVLDFTMGSGTTGVACVNTKRDFIGIELDDKYFAIAVERIKAAKEAC